jgi:hypothetical protein
LRIDNQVDGVLEVVGEATAKTATINTAKIAKLQYILTSGLYKDAMSATVVELTNNGVDAIIESGKNALENPVIIKLAAENREYFLSIEDKGIGMSKEFFEEFFMSMLSSTKEDNDDAIGHFGLGSKAWCSLNRSVTFTIVKDGTKCKYLCYKGDEMIDYDLILEEDTDEENGVLFEMPIVDWKEYEEFKRKAKQKLAYYDTVVLIIDGEIWDNKIYRNDLFQYTLNPPYSQLHLCLKDVVYEIDFDKLNIPPINLPIALRFGLTDGIIPTPSRESYLNSRETIELIKMRIADVADFFVEKYNDSIKEPFTFFDYYDKINSPYKNVELLDKTFEISGLRQYASFDFNDFIIAEMKLKTPAWYKSKIQELLGEFHLKAEYTYHGIWKTARLYANLERKFSIKEKPILTDELRGNLKEFIKEKTGRNKIFISLSHPKDLGWYRRNILGSVAKEKWREHIKEWQAVKEQVIKDFCVDYRGIEKTQEYINWLEKYRQFKKDNRVATSSNYKGLNKAEGDVTISMPRKALIGNTMMFEKKAIPLKDVPKMGLLVLFNGDEVETAKDFANMVVKQKAIIVGVREYSKIKNFQNVWTYSRFMQDNKPFRRIATSLLIEEVLERYNELLGRKNEIVANCLKSVEQDKKDLNTYTSNNYTGVRGETAQAIADLAKNLNLYDEEILPTLRRVEKALETFNFLQYFQKPSYWDEERTKEVSKLINQMLLFRKKYYDLENYELVKK